MSCLLRLSCEATSLLPNTLSISPRKLSSALLISLLDSATEFSASTTFLASAGVSPGAAIATGAVIAPILSAAPNARTDTLRRTTLFLLITPHPSFA